MKKIKTFLKDTIKIDKKKGFIGIGLGLISVILCLVFNDGEYAPFFCILYAVAFPLGGFLKIEFKNKKANYVMYTLWVLATGLVMTFASSAFAGGVTGMLMLKGYQLAVLGDILVYGVIFALIMCITARCKFSAIFSAVFLGIMGTINGFVYQFRGKEFDFPDLFGVGTAMSVAKGYKFEITFEMIVGWTLLALVICAWSMVSEYKPVKKLWVRLGSVASELVILVLLIAVSNNVAICLWGNMGSRTNGFPLNYALSIKYMSIQKPEGYSADKVEEIAEKYKKETEKEADNTSQPNVVILMCESFADLNVIGDVNTNQPVTPFIDSLEENTIKGYALTSVYGGRTADAEFELLTGHTMAFMPENSVPYQQYVEEKMFSLPWLYNSYGYITGATHPYNADGWDRDKVYPLLGFSKSSFIEDYPQEKILRNYVSDQEMFEVLLESLKTDEKDKSAFTFGITMQNHGGYVYEGDNYSQTIYLEGYEGKYPQAEQYLTLLNETDKAVEYLITELESFEEDTVVLFFGDHFPKIENGFYEELKGGSFTSLSDKILQYKMPFFIWANYDIEEREVDYTSFNYLGNYLTEAAGLELSEYQTFVKDAEEVIPAMNDLGYYSKEKGEFAEFDEATGEEKEWLEKYEFVEYNNVFDEPNEIFFGQYIK